MHAPPTKRAGPAHGAAFVQHPMCQTKHTRLVYLVPYHDRGHRTSAPESHGAAFVQHPMHTPTLGPAAEETGESSGV